jgi:hypothetical protein
MGRLRWIQLVLFKITWLEKDEASISFTEAGIEIDLSDEQDENADSSIRSSVDSDSNVNVESDSHQEKHDLQRILTEEGIETDLSDEQDENAYASI